METVKVSVSNYHPRLVPPRRTQGGANTTANANAIVQYRSGDTLQ